MVDKIRGKRETWEHAKECGLDGFVSAVSKAFPGAISDVCIESSGKVSYVNELPRDTVKIAVVTLVNDGLKAAIKAAKENNNIRGLK